MIKIKSLYLKLALVGLVVFSSCRKDDSIIPSEEENLGNQEESEVVGFYLLNEGNWGSNKASLDYYDFSTGLYKRNVYNEANPSVTLGLGDVGNDVKAYGSKLYVVVNSSNKVEVLNLKDNTKIGQIDIPNCRYIAFHNDKAFVTAYDGYVSVIDTASLAEVKQIAVGKQPEEMAVVNNKLYVANSGGYNYPDYENTVSVIDLNSLTETKRIEVDINLNRLKADKYGDIYVTSRGDYYEVPSNLYVINTVTDEVKKKFDIAASNITIFGEYAYVYSVEWNYLLGENSITYSKIDIGTETILEGNFITDGTDAEIAIPYGLAINPANEDIYVTDARDYTSPGVLYCFDKTGKKKFSVTTGDIPAHIAFITKKK